MELAATALAEVLAESIVRKLELNVFLHVVSTQKMQ